MGVRRAKAALSSGCKPHPATAPAGSNRSSHGGNEVAEAKAQGFVPAKDEGKPSGVMYGAHKKFIPELTPQRASANTP